MDLAVISKVQQTTALLIHNLLDAVLPKICVQCEKEGEYLCRVCLGLLKNKNNVGTCLLCRSALLKKESKTFGSTCNSCKQSMYVDGVIVPYEYTSPAIEKSIRALKYRGVREIANILGSAWCTYYESIPYIFRPLDISDTKDIELIPMPLYRSKQLSRGFNQAELIAEIISKNLNWSINKTIAKRSKRTATQTKLTKPERRYNMQGAFEIQGTVQNKTYIIIDDVITSGISIQSLAKELKKKGAKCVWAAAIAHG